MGVVGTFAREAKSAPPPKPERLAAITRLRVLLIGWVVVYHLELALHGLRGVPWIEQAAMKGYLGVDGFFVLSGFGLFLGYRHRPPLGPAGWMEFVRRRAERVYPLHLVALLLLLGMVLATRAAGVPVNDPQRFGAYEFVMQALLLNAWETTTVHAWNYPSWALSAIMAGYLVFPAILPAFLGRRAGACLLIAVLTLAGLAWLGSLPDGAQLNRSLHLGLLRFGLEFLLGIALARLVTARLVEARTATVLTLLIPIGVAIDLDVLTVAGLAALVTRLGMQPPAEAPPRDLLWTLGEASFGVYLCWVFVEAALVLAVRALHPDQAGRLALMVAGLAASLALGWLAWRFVELPAARWLSRRKAAAQPG